MHHASEVALGVSRPAPSETQPLQGGGMHGFPAGRCRTGAARAVDEIHAHAGLGDFGRQGR
eukprot:8761223-Alexandrium_andersonii.AAC.1